MNSRPGPEPATTHLRVGDVSVELRRSSRRRTVALRVGPGGAVLYAPVSVATERLERFLHEREGWLLGHLATFARNERPALEEGSSLPLLGETLTLHLSPGLAAARRDAHLLSADPARLHAQLEAWYSRAALVYFGPLVQRLTLDLGRQTGKHTPLAGVRLTRASGRWGSCTAAGEIRLHWRLMLAPERVAHYVAAHEVAHLAQMNHSARYWATLERLMPGYQEPKRWLKEHGESLTLWD
ncbi:M48 family metallopeptidase [Deinococcus altitudinis]|uniref:M48 family metallopeptidase n=1 Tax=Deinococcus altitudinis TaxID=468914 RepID=UPI003891215C